MNCLLPYARNVKFYVLKVLVLLGCESGIVNVVSRQSMGSFFKGFEFEDRNDRLSRTVGEQLPIHAASNTPEERRAHLRGSGRPKYLCVSMAYREGGGGLNSPPPPPPTHKPPTK